MMTVIHREGTCALPLGARTPDEGIVNCRTRCGWVVIMPFGFDPGFPTCAECASAPGGSARRRWRSGLSTRKQP